jgi:3',5'-cyclic AMP phosphodiesterase CpdA
MSDPIHAAILILSDLHFGADFEREAEIDPPQMPDWPGAKYIAPKARRFFEDKCKSHDMAIVKILPRYLKRVLRDLNRTKFDFVLLLGDLATYANGGSYSFIGQYLKEEKYEYKTGKYITGLKTIHNGELIAIPGNHDKLLRKNLDLFHAKFLLPYGPRPQPQESFFVSRNLNGLEFLFILVEASKYASEDFKLDISALSHLAGGEITDHLKADIKGKFAEVKKGQQVDKAKLDNFELARKILLVHYAVDERMVLGPFPRVQELAVSHRCEGLYELIKDLSLSLDLVLHGHLHCPRIYNHYGVPVISATTTTQIGGANGFYVMKLLASGDMVFNHHKWNENGFKDDETAELNVRIARTPPPGSDATRTISKTAGGD